MKHKVTDFKDLEGQVYDQRAAPPDMLDRVLGWLTGTTPVPIEEHRPENKPPVELDQLQRILDTPWPGYITDDAVIHVPQFHGPGYDLVAPGVGRDAAFSEKLRKGPKVR